jgi:hypothetical protein
VCWFAKQGNLGLIEIGCGRVTGEDLTIILVDGRRVIHQEDAAIL